MANFKVDGSQNQWLNQMSQAQKANKGEASQEAQQAKAAAKAEKAEAQFGVQQSIQDISEGIAEAGKAIGKLDFFMTTESPSSQIEQLRKLKASGSPKFLSAMMNFPSKLNGMSTKELKAMRDYIVNEMASPLNNDDPFLGVLLEKVNEEIDSRNSPFKPWDWDPMPKPLPKPTPWDPITPDPKPLPYFPKGGGGGWPGRVLD